MAKHRENETVRCRYCGEHYSVTYKRCPFCNERPQREYSEEELNATRPFTFVNSESETPIRAERPRRPRREEPVEDTVPATSEESYESAQSAAPRRRSGSRGGKRLATKERPARASAPAWEEEELPREQPRYSRREEDELPREQPRRPHREEEAPVHSSRSVRQADYDDEDDYDDYGEDDRRGISPLSIIGWVVCLALVAAAAIIVFSLLKPLLGGGPRPAPTPTPIIQSTPTPGPGQTPGPVQTADPNLGDAPFTLDYSDLTLSGGQSHQLKVAFTSADAAGAITWSSSDAAVAAVDAFGTVTPVGTGDAVITASLADGRSRACTVHCTSGGAPATPPPSGSTATPAPTPTPSGVRLSINYTDISFSSTYPNPVRLKITGTVSVPVWSIADETVATIASDGTVTPVASGTTTATAAVDGKTFECIIRVNF